MLAPRPVGALTLVYAILAGSWQGIALVGGLSLGAGAGGSGSLLSGLLSLLEGSCFAGYVAGGLGLLLVRRWGSAVTLCTASVEILGSVAALLAGLVLSWSENIRQAHGSLLLLGLAPLVFPLALAYAAWRLRRQPEAWAPAVPRAAAGENAEDPARDARRAASLRRWSRVVLAAGLALPAVVGVVVRETLKARGEPVVSIGAGVGWALLGTPLYALPFAVLAYLGRVTLRGAGEEEERAQPGKRADILWGAFAGMTVAVAWSLFDFYQSPESLQVLIFVPFFPFYAAVPGAVLGALAGWLVFRLRGPAAAAGRPAG